MKDQERQKLREILAEERVKAGERDLVKKDFDEVDHRVKHLVRHLSPHPMLSKLIGDEQTTLAKQVIVRVQPMPIDKIEERIR